MKNILITGGAGFIGSALSNKLVDEGYQVTILDNLSKKIHSDNSAYEALRSKCNFIIGDVNNRSDWENAIISQDAIFHLASETGTGESMYDIFNYSNTNISATALMLDVLVNTKHQVRKIVLSSSRAVYGEGKYFCNDHGAFYPSSRDLKHLEKNDFDFTCPLCNNTLTQVATDESSNINPSSIYAVSKHTQEKMVQIIGESLAINTVILRYQNVFGPGQSLSNPYTGILSIFSTRILNNNDIEIYEDGFESRDFIYIDDVVEASILALNYQNINGEVFNVGSGIATTVLDVAQQLKNNFNSKVNITITKKFRLGDIRHNFADISKLKTILNYHPTNSFESGLRKFVDWVKGQEIQEDNYLKSIEQLKNKGLFR